MICYKYLFLVARILSHSGKSVVPLTYHSLAEAIG